MAKLVVKIIWVTLVASLVLAGCTASEVLKGYVDKPLAEAILEQGPPTASFDMGDGTRAFLWTERNSYYFPGTATTNTTANIYGGYGSASLYGTSTTTYSPPVAGSYDCQYVVFAKRTNPNIEGPAGWTVVDYRKPKFMCE